MEIALRKPMLVPSQEQRMKNCIAVLSIAVEPRNAVSYTIDNVGVCLDRMEYAR